MGAAFLILPIGLSVNPHGLISFWWIVLSYFIQAIAELLVSPIGMSMVSRLSPPKILGLMMGVWYFSTAIANTLAGIISQWTLLPSGDKTPALTMPIYATVFSGIGSTALFAGCFIMLLSPYINRLISSPSMHAT